MYKHHIHALKHYSSLKWNDIVLHTTMWMSLEKNVLHGKWQPQKPTNSIYIKYPQEAKPYRFKGDL